MAGGLQARATLGRWRAGRSGTASARSTRGSSLIARERMYQGDWRRGKVPSAVEVRSVRRSAFRPKPRRWSIRNYVAMLVTLERRSAIATIGRGTGGARETGCWLDGDIEAGPIGARS